MLNWPVTIGMDVDYLVPEYFAADHPQTLKLIRALSRPRDLFDVISRVMGHPPAWPIDDALRANATAAVLRTYHPDITLVHLLELDSVEHRSGPGSPDALATLERIDTNIGTILQTLQAAGMGDAHVAIVSDHGFLPTRTRLQLNAVFKQAGLLTVERGRISSWKAYFHSSGGSGYVYLHDPSNAAVRNQVRELVDTLAADPKNGIRTIWTEDDLKRAGAQPGAAFGIDMESGFYTGAGLDNILEPTTEKGGHGYSPDRPELHASFVVTGAAFKGKGNLGVVRMTQIAPTLAAVLGMRLSPLSDNPIEMGK
jgi:predicted AlkP superfamily pyrophosphatase or phosphodiesterase